MGEHPRSSATHLSGYVIGRATPGDIVEVARLERVCSSDPWADSAFESLPENPAVYFGVARQVGHGVSPILGYVVAWFVLDEGELANLADGTEARTLVRRLNRIYDESGQPKVVGVPFSLLGFTAALNEIMA